MITFYPNCTLPSHRGAYIAAPNVRSTLEIVWSCTSILILCSWSILHLNVPDQYTPQSKSQTISRLIWLTWRKVKWMLLSLAAPEYILAKAMASYRSAWLNLPRLKTLADEDDVPWSMTHNFLADMGGIVIYFPEDLPTRNEEEIEAPESAPNQHILSTSSHKRISDTAEQNSDAIPQRHIPTKHSGLSSSAGAEPGGLRPNPTSVTESGGHRIMPLALTRPPQPHRSSSGITRDRVEDGSIELEHVPRAGMGQRDEPLPSTSQQAKPKKPKSGRERWRSGLAKAIDKFGATAWRLHTHNESIGKAIKLRYNNSDEFDLRQRVYAMEGNMWVLTAIQLEYARRCGIISKLPHITHDEIADKGKGDFVAKALAITQAIWLILQLAVRVGTKKPSSQLEVATLAFSLLSIITYILLFEHPQDLRVPIKTHASRLPSTDEFHTIVEKSPRVFWDMKPSGERFIHNNSVPRVGKDDHHEILYLTVGTSVGSFAFGCVHLLAWNSVYPNETERILWIVSSFITALVPALILILFLISDFVEKLLPFSSTPGQQRVWSNIGYIIFTFIPMAVYIVARAFLIVEMFRSLYFLPPEIFLSVWTKEIPHAGG
ncbi:hypothetical protein PG984_006787 [Apiospora sp. TS-2023a]